MAGEHGAVTDHRSMILGWFDEAIAAVDPEDRTADAMKGTGGPSTIIAIGKAAAAMSRGAARSLGDVTGICVTNAPGEVPAGMDLLIGNHPLPCTASFEAGRRLIQAVEAADEGVVALISGGGSALCEHPRPGIEPDYIRRANSLLLDGGASIDETNLVRRHLSALKCGGLAGVASGPVTTYIVSDVAASGPEIVASGPTIYVPPDPESALEVMGRYGIEVTAGVRAAMSTPQPEVNTGPVTIVAHGRIAARALADAAARQEVKGHVMDGWIGGDVETALGAFLAGAGPSLTVAAGEPNVVVEGTGVGGRNSHTALLAAREIAGSDLVFAALATDGIDGKSDGAGAIVDGTTIERGGNPTEALAESDSATYLETVGDLIRTGPTGTNVSDLWLLWRC